AQAYAAGFPKVISCDIDPSRVEECRTRFPMAAVLQAESTELLGALLPQILPSMGKTLFWLDAHFAGFYGLAETDANRFPLAEELRLIRKNKPDYADDVIAFDDLRVIRDPLNPRYRQGELSGEEAQLYIDVRLEELLAPFAATHEAAFVHAQEGSVALLPKSVTAARS
ncbi:MAG: hypothetical protein ACRD1E_04840, partial [Terriglobales bacterium]